jgi:hypothetical protein
MLAVHILCVHVQELDLMQSYKQANIFDLTMFQIYINRQKYMNMTTQEQQLWFSSPESVQLWVAALDQKRQACKLPDYFFDRYLEGLINYIDTKAKFCHLKRLTC